MLVAAVVVAIDLGEPGLHFDHHAAYASKYDNYVSFAKSKFLVDSRLSKYHILSKLFLGYYNYVY